MPRWDVQFDLTVDATNPRLVNLVAQSHALASVIRQLPIPPYLQRELDSLNISRAVRGTTAIEGAQVSPEEVRSIMEARPGQLTLPASRQRDEQEVRNAQSVLTYVEQLLTKEPSHPLSEGLICKIHELTTAGIAYDRNVPGQYRSHAVVTGDYQPPETGDQVRSLMKAFVRWFHSPPASNWDPAIRAIAVHFYLISIHPFGDGNGRTSRAIESFLLYQGRINARGFYSLANFYYQHRSDYVWHLDNARFGQAGLTPFILFALEGLVGELETVHQEVLQEVKLISYRDYAREMFLREGRLSSKVGMRLFRLLMTMSKKPIAINQLINGEGPAEASYKGVARRTVYRDIEFLLKRKLVKQEGDSIVLNLGLMDQFTADPKPEQVARVTNV